MPESEPRRATSVENRPSRTRSDVGRVPRPGGTASRRPPSSPATIRVTRDPSGLLEIVGAVGVEQLAYRGDQRVVVGQSRVVVDEPRRLGARIGDDLLVAQQAQQPQTRAPPRLRGTEDVALTALLEVEARE